MAEKIGARLLVVAPVVVCGALVSGCMSSPTYGTGKASSAQLMEDVTGILSLGPKDRPQIDYKPRPELVKPGKPDPNAVAAGAGVPLPAPQESVKTASNGAWPESPEQTRARLRAEATANENNPDYDSPIQADVESTKSKGVTSLARLNDRGNFEEMPDPDKQREEFKKRLAETGQGSPTTRRFLSEPPLVYREASATAPVGDVGEPEWKKDRRSKRAAKKKGTGGWWPW